VLDDAFQHLRLARDLNLILLDSRLPFGNAHLLPRGTLREPPAALLRSDAILITRSDKTVDVDRVLSQLQSEYLIRNKPVFRSVHIYGIQKMIPAKKDMARNGSRHSSGFSLECLAERDVFAFSGIAGNDDFRKTVEGFGCTLKGFRAFPDHHRYSDLDLDALLQLSREVNADIVLTTEKDYVRISKRIAWPVDVAVIGMETSFGDNTDDFNRFIKSRLEKILANTQETLNRKS
jgi:tetraacyldisaccharide 4'-kinase